MAITVDSIFKLIESGKLTPEEKSLTEKFATRTSYDVEGSSLNPMMADFRLGGIGLSNASESGYLLFRDYTNPSGEMSEETRQKLRGLMMFISKNKASVFNAGYEYAVTLSQFGVRTEFNDVFMMGKTLDHKGGLKEQAQVHLGIRGWTNEIDKSLELLEVILNQFKPTKDSKQECGFRDKKEYILLRDKGIREAVAVIFGKELKGTPIITAAFSEWLEITGKLYRSEELAYQYLENWIKYKREVMDFEVRYTDIPAWKFDENNNKVAAFVSQYCCLDCHYTDQLRDKYRTEIESRGLVHASEVYNRQMQFACALETNGFKWDDAKAESLKDQYSIEATESLKQFLLVPRTKKILEINSVQEIEILSATNFEQLKKYFNPDSTAPANTAKLSEILSTDKIKMAMMFSQLLTDSQQMDSTTEAEHPLLMKLIYSFNRDNLPKDYVVMVIKAIIHANSAGTLNEFERAMLGRYSRWTLPDATSETIEAVANAAKRFLGVDLDNPETWTEDYKLVFYYKKVKKITKAISSFIDGKNGRKAVKVVSKILTPAGYYHRVSDYRKDVNPNTEFHLYCPEYGVCSAETRRWTSAFHGLPAASDIKSCFVPIQEDGIFVHADFSQNEYKVFAALAKEDGIVQAFREGKDIHRFIASKTFQKPESEITGAERNVAKRLSFGLLYGKSVAAIADEYFRGDIKYAQKLFDDFFTMFPRVKAYIEEQKEMLFSKGYVTTVFGDPIYITYDPNKKSSVNDAIRYSGNYPTQSSASSAAALVGEKIDKLARDRAWDLYLAGFIHDCEEGSFATPLLIDVFTEYPKMAETFPYETYGLPMSIDIEIGVCGGPGLVEFKREKGKLVFVEDGVLTAKFEGETSYVDQLFQRIGKNFTVDFSDVEEEAVYQSWSEMYLRVASSYRSSLGKETVMKSGKVRIHR